MSVASSLSEAIDRLSSGDATLSELWFQDDESLDDAAFAQLLDALARHANDVSCLVLYDNQLTDASGSRLAAFLGSNTTLHTVCINQMTDATYVAIAEALHSNRTLSALHMYDNRVAAVHTCDAAFAAALLAQPARPSASLWFLYSNSKNELPRLRQLSESLGPPDCVHRLRSLLGVQQLRHLFELSLLFPKLAADLRHFVSSDDHSSSPVNSYSSQSTLPHLSSSTSSYSSLSTLSSYSSGQPPQLGTSPATGRLLECLHSGLAIVSAAGDTPLLWAAKNGLGTLVQLLHDAGAPLQCTDADGLTPLHWAASNGHAALASLLLQLRCGDVDPVDGSGRTPLLLARQRDVAKLLIDAGADLYAALNNCTAGEQCLRAWPDFAALPAFSKFSPAADTLDFSRSSLSNASAALIPFRNWRSCRVRTVDFRRNAGVTEIPASLRHLNAERVGAIVFDPPSADWNPIEAQIADSRDARQIIDYAALKAEGALVPVVERKLMAVGHSAVGKTTLVRRLRNKGYTKPVSTDGVAMGTLRLSTDDGRQLRFVVWDFAGQPLYRCTHLLFLRNPGGVCLLVFKLNEEPAESVEQLRFWCETIVSLTPPDSAVRVLLVGTHLDRCRSADEARNIAAHVWQQLQAVLSQQVAVCGEPVLVSCAAGAAHERTVAALRAAIAAAAAQIDTLAPACIEVVRAALQPASARDVPIVSAADAHALIVEHAKRVWFDRLIADRALRDTCLRSLQAVGAVVLVEQRGRVTDVVANPQWIALLLASVVTTRHTWVDTGRVTFRTLSTAVWTDARHFPAAVHDTLVAVLVQLQILFRLQQPPAARQRAATPLQRFGPAPPEPLPGAIVDGSLLLRLGVAPAPPSDNAQSPLSACYFVPCVLPERQPDLRFALPPATAANVWRRLFKLTAAERSIPVGALPSVVVQLMTAANSELRLVWQQGGVFRVDGGVYVLVRRSAVDEIELVVQSSAYVASVAARWLRDLSTVVHNQLADTYRLQYATLVPCTDERSSCSVALDQLRASVLQRQQQVVCQPGGRHQWRVDALVPDLLFADLDEHAFVYDWQQVELVDELGTGATGRVMLGRLHSSNDEAWPVAVKLLESVAVSVGNMAQSVAVSVGNMAQSVAVSVGNMAQSVANFREFHHEAYLMSLLSHPNVVRFVGVCFPSPASAAPLHQRAPAMLMELVPGGTLYDSLRDSVGLQKICTLALDIVAAIARGKNAQALYAANPARFEHPSLPPFDQLCDGAAARIDAIFETRVFARFARVAERPGAAALRARLALLRDTLRQQLLHYYAEASSKQLDTAVLDCVGAVQSLLDDVNGLLVRVDWPLLLKLALDVVQGVMHLHAMQPPLVHRDLKSPNIFLAARLDSIDDAAVDWRTPLAKVGDFGLSVRMLGACRLNVGSALHGITPTWAAPEVLTRASYSTEADVYAVGILLWELLTRRHPFDHVPLPAVELVAMRKLAALIASGERPQLPADNDGAQRLATASPALLADYVALLQACWHGEPEQRPSIDQVYVQLRLLAQRAAPQLFAVLPDVSAVLPASGGDVVTLRARGTAVRYAYSAGRVDVLPLPLPPPPEPANVPSSASGAETQHPLARWFASPRSARPSSSADVTPRSSAEHEQEVLCMQHVADELFWLGLSSGHVAVVDAGSGAVTYCGSVDRHGRDVNALCYNAYQQQTVWSGSSDGRVFVWTARPQTVDEARSSYYLKDNFRLVESSLRRPRRGAALHLVVRHGRLHCYVDEFVGPAFAEIDLCQRGGVQASTRSDGALQLSIADAGGVDDVSLLCVAPTAVHRSEETVARWQHVIASLAQVGRAGVGLCRVAASSPARRDDTGIVIAVETVGESTWSLSSGRQLELTEWALRFAHHGLDRTLLLEPCRRVVVDMAAFEPRLRCATRLLWVAPDLLWLAAADTVAAVDVSARTVHWPTAGHAGHAAPIRLMALVSATEAWTYADSASEVLVWQTPDDEDEPLPRVLLARLPLPTSADGSSAPLRLTCLAQVNTATVCAGSEDGTVVAWDVATRRMLAEPWLPDGQAHRQSSTGKSRPVTAIAAAAATPTPYLLTAGLEPSLRKIVLAAQRKSLTSI